MKMNYLGLQMKILLLCFSLLFIGCGVTTKNTIKYDGFKCECIGGVSMLINVRECVCEGD